MLFKVPANLNSIKIESINLHDIGTISATNQENKPVSITVKKIDVKPKTISNLSNLKIEDEINIDQSASIKLEKVTLDKATLNLDLHTYILSNYVNKPLLSGTLGKAPSKIYLKKPADGSSPLKSVDYIILQGDFETSCDEWKGFTNIDDTLFNEKACVDYNAANAILLDQKSLVVRDNGKEPENNNKNKLSGGAIAGIVIGCIAAVAIIVVVIVLVMRKKKNTDSSDENGQDDAEL